MSECGREGHEAETESGHRAGGNQGRVAHGHEMGGRQDELLILLLLFDPLQDPNNLEAYMYSNIFLPDINNEREDKDSSYADNLASLTRLVLYRFEDDTTGVRELHNSSAGPFSCVDLRSAVCVTCKLRGILKACCWNRGGCWLIACPRLRPCWKPDPAPRKWPATTGS